MRDEEEEAAGTEEVYSSSSLSPSSLPLCGVRVHIHTSAMSVCVCVCVCVSECSRPCREGPSEFLVGLLSPD